jgi:hypothetical protein
MKNEINNKKRRYYTQTETRKQITDGCRLFAQTCHSGIMKYPISRIKNLELNKVTDSQMLYYKLNHVPQTQVLY